jgi:hypothetical protein
MSLFHKGRTLAHELRHFFGCEPSVLPVVNHDFSPVDLPNLQIAIETYAQAHVAHMQTLGYTGSITGIQDSLADLVGEKGALMGLFLSAKTGPVLYRMVNIDLDKQKPCVERGVFLIHADRGKLAVHLRRDATFRRGNLELEVMCADEDMAATFLNEIRAHVRTFNVYRGKVLSLDCDGESIQFHCFPSVKREDIILPEATMTFLERNTIWIFEARRGSARQWTIYKARHSAAWQAGYR